MTSRDALLADLAATLGYVANWHFIASSNYFQATGDDNPLLHMWTLAVEEQFYVVCGLWRFSFIALLVPHRARLTVVAAVAVSGVLVSAWRLHTLWVCFGNPRSGVHGHRLAHVRSYGRRSSRRRAHARPAPGSLSLAEHGAHGRGFAPSSSGRRFRGARRHGPGGRPPWRRAALHLVRLRSSGPCRPVRRESPRCSRSLPSHTSAESRTASTSGIGRSSSGRKRVGST